MKKSFRDTLVVGFALFAMFLGAGNIIFPPFMGAQSGWGWWISALGFVLSGTLLPILGVIAVSNAGGTANDLSHKVSPRFAVVLNTIMLLFIGPLFAVPRTAATTYELSVLPFWPETWQFDGLNIVANLIFFLLCLALTLKPNNVVDKVGRYLTPILLMILFVLITLSIITPMRAMPEPATNIKDLKLGALPAVTDYFRFGFKNGYQTMDAIGAVVFGGTVLAAFKSKGYEKEEAIPLMRWAGLISGSGTMLVYFGFTWIGASGSLGLQALSRTELLTTLVMRLAGDAGKVLLALCIFFACLTTAAGLIVTASEYFQALFKGKFTYRQICLMVTLISFAISIIGVDGIILLAGPALELIYPMVIVLVGLNLLNKYIKHREVYILGVIFTVPFSLINAMKVFRVFEPVTSKFLSYIPFQFEGFESFLLAFLGMLLGYLVGVSRMNQK